MYTFTHAQKRLLDDLIRAYKPRAKSMTADWDWTNTGKKTVRVEIRYLDAGCPKTRSVGIATFAESNPAFHDCLTAVQKALE